MSELIPWSKLDPKEDEMRYKENVRSFILRKCSKLRDQAFWSTLIVAGGFFGAAADVFISGDEIASLAFGVLALVHANDVRKLYRDNKTFSKEVEEVVDGSQDWD